MKILILSALKYSAKSCSAIKQLANSAGKHQCSVDVQVVHISDTKPMVHHEVVGCAQFKSQPME